MDEIPASGPTPERTAPGSSTRPVARTAKATKATKATKSSRALAARRAPTSDQAASATRATKATAAAPLPTEDRGGKVAGSRPDDGPGTGRNHQKGPWREARNRALYNPRVQRVSEHWPVATRAVAGLLRHPDLVLSVLGGRRPVERDGRVLNRGVQAMLELSVRFDGARGGPDTGGQPADPRVMRAQMRQTTRLAMPVRTDVHAWGRVVPGPEGAPPVPVRLYRQYGAGLGLGGDARLIPGIVYYHGGSWVTGDLETHDATCRLLAATARCLVVAVDYRLAPEHPFPAAVDDAVAAYAWVQRHAGELGVDRHRVGVMGDSAGGNLAAVVALEARGGESFLGDEVLPPVAQGLVYPVVDARLETETLRTLSEGFFLTRAAMEAARAQYLPDPADWTEAKASPLLAEDHRGVAPALVVTAGFDPLRDDGAHYTEVLRAAGVDVEYRCYDDQVHGFMGMGILADSLALATEVCEAMGRLVRRSD